MERDFKKRIEETRKQAEMIRRNKERHQQDLLRKLEEEKKRREKVREETLKNMRTAEERKINIQKKREEVHRNKQNRVQMTHEELMTLKDCYKKNERQDLHKKIKQKIEIENKKLMAKRMRQEAIIERINAVKMNHHRDAHYERELAALMSARAGSIEEEERKMFEKLRTMEEHQQQAIEELKHALFE